METDLDTVRRALDEHPLSRDISEWPREQYEEVAAHILVPRRFTQSVPAMDRSGNKIADARVVVEIDNGIERLVNARFEPALDVEQLGSVDWRFLLQLAFGLTVRGMALLESQKAEGNPDKQTAIEQEANAAAPYALRRRRTNNRLNGSDYRRIAALYQAEGREAVADEFYVGVRQANRYIEQARERGYL
jgi:hypothetical protein